MSKDELIQKAIIAQKKYDASNESAASKIDAAVHNVLSDKTVYNTMELLSKA